MRASWDDRGQYDLPLKSSSRLNHGRWNGHSDSDHRSKVLWTQRQDTSSGRYKPAPDADNSNDLSPFATSDSSRPKVDQNDKRRMAAMFVREFAGIEVPHETDYEFRSRFTDGVILCKILNSLFPNSISKVIETDDWDSQTNSKVKQETQSKENIGKFLDAWRQVTETYRLGTKARFSYSDLSTGDSWEERPGVVDCLLQLKNLWERGYPVNAGTSSRAPATSPGLSRRLSGSNGSVTQNVTSQILEQVTESVKAATSGSVSEALDATSLELVLNGVTKGFEKRLFDARVAYADLERQFNDQKYSLMEEIKTLTTRVEELEATSFNPELQAELEKRLADALQQVGGLKDEVQRLQSQLAISELHHQKEGQLSEALLERERQLEEFAQRIEEGRANMQRIKTENKRLYNSVQDLKGAIRIFCRVRPVGATGDFSSSCVNVASETELTLYDPNPEKPKRTMFKFDNVFNPDVQQQEVYAEAQPLIRSVLDGYNVCIFAYGQTGSGKTHTMSGTNFESEEGQGINYRALYDLFELKAERSCEVDYVISVQMLEIYNDSIRDLLTDDPRGSSSLQMNVTQPSGLNVPGAVRLQVGGASDVLSIMAHGAKNRRSAETKMNERSSRSHLILTVIVDGVTLETGAKTHACLHLIDLAGSERVRKSEAAGDRLIEANHINASLAALGKVLAALANKEKHVPFRDSKLTQLLQDSLQGNAKVTMFVHVAPEASSYPESISTLQFAHRVAEITLGQAKKNVENGALLKAQDDISRLRDSLQQKENALIKLENENRSKDREIESLRQQLRSLEISRAWQEQNCMASVESLKSVSRLSFDGKSPAMSRLHVQAPGGESTPRSSCAPTPRSSASRQTAAEAHAERLKTARALKAQEPQNTRLPVSRQNSAISARAGPTTKPLPRVAIQSAKQGGTYSGARPSGIPVPSSSGYATAAREESADIKKGPKSTNRRSASGLWGRPGR